MTQQRSKTPQTRQGWRHIYMSASERELASDEPILMPDTDESGELLRCQKIEMGLNKLLRRTSTNMVYYSFGTDNGTHPKGGFIIPADKQLSAVQLREVLLGFAKQAGGDTQRMADDMIPCNPRGSLFLPGYLAEQFAQWAQSALFQQQFSRAVSAAQSSQGATPGP